eukprot:c25951_g1_i1 orf=352-1152(-)
MAETGTSEAGIAEIKDTLAGFDRLCASCANEMTNQKNDYGTTEFELSLEKEQSRTMENYLENRDMGEFVDEYQKAWEDLETFTLESCSERRLNMNSNTNIVELYERLKTKMESADFLGKLESIHEASVAKSSALCSPEDQGSWDVITKSDLVSGEPKDVRNCLDQESYIVVTQEDIVEGMACFMARYLYSIPQIKEMSPKQLQCALRKALGTSTKGRFKRWWDGSKAFYTAASWGATAVSLYNNEAFISVAAAAFGASCRAIMKFI